MAADDKLIFYHSPHSRSGGVLVLLEELGAPYDLHPLNLKAGEQRQPAYLAINPMGKVPAIFHNGALVTEQVAVYLYLADAFPDKGLAPPIGDPLRGPYLRWLAFYGSCFEPAMIDRSQKREPAPLMSSPYGTFDDVMRALNGQLAKGPYLLGERFTAADVLWGSALSWMTMFKLIPESPEIVAYLKGVADRPAQARARQIDAKLIAAQSEQKSGQPPK